MPFGDRVMQRRVPGQVGRVQGAPVLDQQIHHRHGTHRRGPVQGVLAAFVADARRGGRLLLEQLLGDFEVVLGGYEVEDRLPGRVLVRSAIPHTPACRAACPCGGAPYLVLVVCDAGGLSKAGYQLKSGMV